MRLNIEPIVPFGIVVRAEDPTTRPADLDVSRLRELFRDHQLVLLRGFADLGTTEEFVRFCERWGEISLWPFGKVLELVEHANPRDHIFDHGSVPMHWDGMYRPQVPEYQIFRCVNAPSEGQGGRTTFANTVAALADASTEHRNLWNRATGTYEREMEFYKSQTVSPLVTKHPQRDLEVIRYNEPPPAEEASFLNPPRIVFTGIEDAEQTLLRESLRGALYNPAHFYAHEWRTGDVVIADNFSLLHGREKFVSGSRRHLQRVHVLSDPPFDNPALRSHR